VQRVEEHDAGPYDDRDHRGRRTQIVTITPA
jgi:hypothetical protein